MALLAGCFALSAFAQVNLNIGNLAPSESVTITYEVTINSPLDVSVTEISHQGTVSGDNFSTVNTDDPDTVAANDATVTVLLQDFDFGDAPDPTYPTLLASGGAQHFVPAGGATLFLGAIAPDFEADGQPNGTATGDDVTDTADEDGVMLPATFPGGATVNIDVVASANGVLNAWIDWNADGDWNDAGEQVATDAAVSAGGNMIPVTAPGGVASGGSFARFRLSTQSGLLPAGQAPDGEVEDYAVMLLANAAPVAGEDTLGTLQNRAATVSATKLLVNDSDPDGDALSVTGVSATSTNGGSVVLMAGSITYTPLAPFSGTDRFTYSVSDVHGVSATGTVVVTVDSADNVSLNVVFGPVIDGTEFVVRFAGIPGETFTIEFTDSLSPANWQKKTNMTAPVTNQGFGIGVFEFREDTGGAPQRFYRTVHPAY